MQGPSALAGALCRFLNEERIEHCLLGAGLGEWVELVVPQAMLVRMPAALRSFCARNELELVRHERGHDRVDRYRLGTSHHDRRPEFTFVAVRSDYLRCGHLIFTAAELLRDRVSASSSSVHARGCFLAAPAREFLCHLLLCIDAGGISDRDASHLSEQWRQDSTGVAMQVERFWSSAREGSVILRAAASGNWEAVHASIRRLQSALRFRNIVPPFAWLREQLGDLRRWFRPEGLLIACLGPEGSGKGSVIAALSERPLEPFRHVHTMELRPGVMRPGTIKPGRTTRKHAPRGRMGAMAKLTMFVVDYWLGYWLRIRPRLVRATLVLSNRYFDDVLVDPRRYRIDRPRAFARLLLRWIPRPELWFILDIPSAALQQRQDQLGPDEAARQRGEYRRVLRGHENVVVLDASQPLDQVVAQAERAIVAQLARRTARRLGLPLDTMSNPAATKVLLFFCRRDVPLFSRIVRVLFNSDIHSRLPPDVHMPHPYGIVIHPQAVIGRRVTLMQQVTIGGKDHHENIAPIIGDDVYIGAGARVLGDVRIGPGVVIGANAVVTRDVPAGMTVVGANRLVTTPRAVHAALHPSDSSVTRLPVGTQRGARIQSR